MIIRFIKISSYGDDVSKHIEIVQNYREVKRGNIEYLPPLGAWVNIQHPDLIQQGLAAGVTHELLGACILPQVERRVGSQVELYLRRQNTIRLLPVHFVQLVQYIDGYSLEIAKGSRYLRSHKKSAEYELLYSHYITYIQRQCTRTKW